jgi:hypothetical protein
LNSDLGNRFFDPAPEEHGAAERKPLAIMIPVSKIIQFFKKRGKNGKDEKDDDHVDRGGNSGQGQARGCQGLD